MKKKPEQMMLDTAEETDVLSRLSERVEKAITIIQQLQRERDELRRKLAQRKDVSALEEENERLRSERDEIRARLAKLLENLDRLEEM